jgi:hypothetical protein
MCARVLFMFCPYMSIIILYLVSQLSALNRAVVVIHGLTHIGLFSEVSSCGQSSQNRTETTMIKHSGTGQSP